MKTLNERIVELQKIDSAGVISTEEAELRQVDLLGMEPRYIKVVLAREFGVQLTMDWDAVNEKFSTEHGGNTWNSNFNYKDFIESPWAQGKNYVRSTRRR